MIEFRPAKLSIKGFRGIPELTLDFYKHTPNYLIGPNNAGKSTILQAVALSLRAGGFYKFTPTDYDFFHRSDGVAVKSFEINLEFTSEDKLPSVHSAGPVVEVSAAQVAGRSFKNGRMEHSHRLLDVHGNTIHLATEMKLSKGDAEDYADAGHGYKRRNARLNDIRDYVPDVWLLTAGNLDSSLYSWKTGPLNRLSEMMSREFFQDKWEFSYGAESRAMPKGIEKAHAFFNAAVKEFPFWKNTLRPALEQSLSTFLGRSTSIELNPSLQDVQDWLQQRLAMSFAGETGAALTPLERMGDGYQSLVRLAALDVLATMDHESNNSVILLYEEPETFLHPHLRRKLRDVFSKLAERGWTILCATHAPEFISFATPQHISRLRREGDQLSHGALRTTDVSEDLKLQEKLDEYGNHEAFFAQKLILCEGKDDLFALQTYLRKAGVELDASSISVLSCGGVGNIADFGRLASKLGIPFCAVTDTDRDHSGQVKKKTKDAREAISAVASSGDLMVEWDNNLEECLDTPFVQNQTKRTKASPEWQRQKITPLNYEALVGAYPSYHGTCEKVVEWL